MHTPQDMPQEVSSQSSSPEQTMGGTQYYCQSVRNWSEEVRCRRAEMSEQAHFIQAEENSQTQLRHNTPAQGKKVNAHK